jgi:hypothetical protein
MRIRMPQLFQVITNGVPQSCSRSVSKRSSSTLQMLHTLASAVIRHHSDSEYQKLHLHLPRFWNPLRDIPVARGYSGNISIVNKGTPSMVASQTGFG